MGLIKGGFLRLSQTLLYVLAFCCAAIILGIYSYFLAVLAKHNLDIPTWQKAVEGLSGAAVLYAICAILLTCCLAGIAFFSFLGLFMDLLFMGAMIAIAVLTRQGAKSCHNNVKTPLGSGLGSDSAPGAGDLGYVCRLNKTVFAVAIAGAILFLITALMQILLARHHKKEKAFGPSPDNDYTSGSTNRKMWQRKPKNVTEKDVEYTPTGTVVEYPLTGPVHTSAGLPVETRAAPSDLRPSHDTGYTGSTVAAPNNIPMYAKPDAVEPPIDGHAAHVGWTPVTHNHTGGYHTAPTTGGNARNF